MRLFTVLSTLLFVAILAASTFGEVSIRITNPQSTSEINPCSDLTITAEVTVTAGEVVQYVYLYNQGRTLRRLRAEPWEYAWKAIKKGVYEISAMAETADGTQVWSEAVFFKVGSVSNGEKLYSGGFDCGVLTPWTGQLNEGAIATFTVFDDGYFDDPYYLYVEIENGGSDVWHIQLNQQCPLDSGHVYTITFLADSENPKTIAVGMQESQDPWASQVWQSVDIDGADEYNVEFTATRTDPTNALRFNLGNNTIPFYLDDVRVIDRSATSVKSKQLDFDRSVVSEYELYQAFPNPFNLSTTIQYRLSTAAEVALDVFNMRSQRVRTLVAAQQSAGLHSVRWNGLDESGAILPSGIYIYKLHVDDGLAQTALSRKMLLVK